MINLLREEEESHLNLEKFLYLVNPGHVPAGTQNWFNFVPLALVIGVYFANTPCHAGAETPKWKADKILHIRNQKQPTWESNNAELLSCSFPLALQNQPTYDPFLAASVFIVQVSHRGCGGLVSLPALQVRGGVEVFFKQQIPSRNKRTMAVCFSKQYQGKIMHYTKRNMSTISILSCSTLPPFYRNTTGLKQQLWQS